MISKTAFARFRFPFLFSLFCAGIAIGPSALGALPVIPGAAGYGIDTPAGRGGKVYRVTTLDDSGPGSLRECVTASGPRVCVFEISGSIRLESKLVVENPHLTIAGQTAPDPGILIRNAGLYIDASDVLVQHIAVRVGDDPDGEKPDIRDTFKIGGHGRVKNVVIDHSSFSWGIDGVVDIWGDWSDVTVLNSIISEPLHDSLHSEGKHGFNMLIGSYDKKARVALVGNLLAHGFGRNPRSGAAEFVFVNNVVYNPGEFEAMLFNAKYPTRNSIVGNVFIKGQSSREAAKPVFLTGPDAVGVATEIVSGTRVHVADNAAYGATDDPWSVIENDSTLPRKAVEAIEPPVWPDGLEALPVGNNKVRDAVLENAGTRPAQRNSVDARIVREVKDGTGTVINCVSDDGTKRCEKNGGGWPELAVNKRPLELPPDPDGDEDGDGYTNLEEWLHAMAAEVEGRAGDKVMSNADEGREIAPPEAPQLH